MSNYRANNGTLCLGPVNEYFVRGLLRTCSAHAAARELAARGLPLRTALLRALRGAATPAEGCGCLYTRLGAMLEAPAG